jgi:uncharacterized protein
MKMQLTFSGSIQAIDNGDRRIIAGKIAPYGEIGNTSAGKVMFAPGSITAAEISKVKLLMSHDNSQVIGRMQSMTSDESGLYASFKISASTKGNDAILLAQEQLMDGLSVGVEVIASKPEKDYLLVTSASLREVSLVETPAFVGAGVQKIAASESDTVEQPNQPIETESEATVTTAPETPNEDKTEEAAAPTVEAARPIIRPSALNSQSVRSPITTGGAYLEHTIKASLGNDDSRLYVKAADDSFTTNPAFSPVSYVRDVATNTNAMRPVIDACGGTRALSSYGMTVSIPKITANSTAATVAEGGDPTGTTAITSAYVNATVIKKMGFPTLQR